MGTDAGHIAGIEAPGVLISETLDDDQFDVLMDFTHPTVTALNVDYCLQHGKKWSSARPVATRLWSKS